MKNIPSHLGGCVVNNKKGDPGTYAPQVWDEIIKSYKPKTVLDIGCGAGYSLEYFIEKGLSGLGIEGLEEAKNRSPVKDNIVIHDYTTGAYTPDKTFDLGWSCEFVEHVEERYVKNFMQSFASCKIVAMTHARPGQRGRHHVNCRTREYWISVFQDYGFNYLEEKSLELRSLLIGARNGRYVRNTLIVFEKAKHS